MQSLIYILLSHVLRANPSYEMAVRAHLHHGSLISETVLFAHLLVCSLSWTTSMERARSSLGRHVPDRWWSGGRLVVFLALVGNWSRVSGIARRGLRRRSSEIPLATDNECAMHSGRRDRDEGEPPSRPVGSLQHHLLLSPEHTDREQEVCLQYNSKGYQLCHRSYSCYSPS